MLVHMHLLFPWKEIYLYLEAEMESLVLIQLNIINEGMMTGSCVLLCLIRKRVYLEQPIMEKYMLLVEEMTENSYLMLRCLIINMGSGLQLGQCSTRFVEKLDPCEGIWRSISDMNVRRGSHSMVVLNEKLCCFGGFDGERMNSSTETYEPRTNSWIMNEYMKFDKGYAGAAVLENVVYAIGGTNYGKLVDIVRPNVSHFGLLMKKYMKKNALDVIVVFVFQL